MVLQVDNLTLMLVGWRVVAQFEQTYKQQNLSLQLIERAFWPLQTEILGCCLQLPIDILLASTAVVRIELLLQPL